MPFVFLVAAAAATVYFLRLRRQETAPSTSGGFWTTSQVRPALVGISGWLLVYVVGLAIELAHGLALTIGSASPTVSPPWQDFTPSYRYGHC